MVNYSSFKGTHYPILYGSQLTFITYMKSTSSHFYWLSEKSTVLFPKLCFYESLFRDFMLKKSGKSYPFFGQKSGNNGWNKHFIGILKSFFVVKTYIHLPVKCPYFFIYEPSFIRYSHFLSRKRTFLGIYIAFWWKYTKRATVCSSYIVCYTCHLRLI